MLGFLTWKLFDNYFVMQYSVNIYYVKQGSDSMVTYDMKRGGVCRFERNY